MPGLTKIGFSESVLSERFAALQGTGVPVPFELFAAFHVADPRGCEKAIHGMLADARVADNREFFRIQGRDALTRIMPLVLAHLSEGDGQKAVTVDLYGDLDEQERDLLAAFTMAPGPQRPNGWEWIESLFDLGELDSRHIFHSLKTKGYLREVRGTAGATLYDLAARGVAFGRMARELPEFQDRYGDRGFFYRQRL